MNLGVKPGTQPRQSLEPSEPSEPPSEDRALVAAETLARWLDDRFLDPLLGLVLPGVGDLLGSLLGLYPVLLAAQRRAPKALLARMLLNLAADAVRGHWSDSAMVALAVVAVIAACALPILVAVGLWHLFARALGR